MAVDVRISVVESEVEDGSALASLYRWLEDDLGPDAELSPRPRSAPDAQGGAFDVITAVINSGVGLGGLALSYAGWRQAHRSRAKIGFERDGLTVVVEDASAESLQRLAEILSGPAGPSGSATPIEPAIASGDSDSGADGSSAAQ